MIVRKGKAWLDFSCRVIMESSVYFGLEGWGIGDREVGYKVIIIF